MARFEEFVSRPGAMGEVAQRVMLGETLRGIAKALALPYAKLAEWVTEDVARSEQYARASRIWVDTEARETVAIADALGPDATKAEIAAAREQIKARQFIATKLDRERYGDKRDVSVEVTDSTAGMDREQLILETARSVGYFLTRAAAVVEQRAKETVAIEVQPAQPQKPDEPEEDPI